MSVNENVLFVQEYVQHVVFLMDMEQTHQPLWNQDWIYSRRGGGGVSMLFNLKKKKKKK